MSELRFRSSYLKSMPTKRSTGRTGRILRRTAVVGSVLALLVILVLIVARRAVPPTGFGYGLYWLHDKIYLPWKGYAVTRYFPESLIWWGVAGTFATLWLALFILDRSLVRQPHIVLIRRALKRPRLFPFLLTGARSFSRIGIRPQLFQAVVKQERDLVLNRVTTEPLRQAEDAECERLVDLTRLQIDLLLLPPITDSARLAAAVQWHEAFLAVRVYGNASLAQMHVRLTRLTRHLAHCALPSCGEATVDSTTQPSEPFSPISVMVDLQHIARVWSVQATQRTPEAEDGGAREGLAELARSMQARRRWLMKTYSAVEQRELRARPDGHAIEVSPAPASPEDLTYVGRLALSIALDMADLANDPELSIGYVDAVEALNFALALAPAGQYQQIALLVNGLPRSEDYWLCAQLASQSLQTRREPWQFFLDQKDSPVREEDYELAAARAAAWAHAAGPAYSVPAYPGPSRMAEL